MAGSQGNRVAAVKGAGIVFPSRAGTEDANPKHKVPTALALPATGFCCISGFWCYNFRQQALVAEITAQLLE